MKVSEICCNFEAKYLYKVNGIKITDMSMDSWYMSLYYKW